MNEKTIRTKKFIKTFISKSIPKYIGEYMASTSGSIIAIVIVVIIILFLNPGQIRSDYWRMGIFIIGLGVLLMGSSGASKYRRSDKVGGSIMSIIIGTVLILYGLGFINVLE